MIYNYLLAPDYPLKEKLARNIRHNMTVTRPWLSIVPGEHTQTHNNNLALL
jgi:hypothetical protein